MSPVRNFYIFPIASNPLIMKSPQMHHPTATSNVSDLLTLSLFCPMAISFMVIIICFS